MNYNKLPRDYGKWVELKDSPDINALDGWESPVTIVTESIKKCVENANSVIEGKTMEAILNVGIEVNKDELIKAMQYDRDQYQKGYIAGYNADKWISVEDRLPSDSEPCLVCCDKKCIDGSHKVYVCDGFYAGKFKLGVTGVDDEEATEYNEADDEYYLKEGWYEVVNNWSEYFGVLIYDKVTHWQALPTPPKMKGAENE